MHWLVQRFVCSPVASATVLVSVVSVLPLSANAQAEPGLSKAKIEIIAPLSVAPMFAAAPFSEDGPAVHRQVISHQKDNALYLDVGYNTYKAGLRITSKVKVAYTTDEFCYSPYGEAEIASNGSVDHIYGGTLDWRPAGASTEGATFIKDTLTICVMVPARIESQSYMVPQDEIGKWTGDPAAQPKVHYYMIRAIPPLPSTGLEDARGKILQRQVLSRQRDGSTKVDVAYTEFRAGSRLTVGPRPGAQICWLEVGEMRILSDGIQRVLEAQDFVYRPEGATIDDLKALKDSKLLCFSAPSQF